MGNYQNIPVLGGTRGASENRSRKREYHHPISILQVNYGGVLGLTAVYTVCYAGPRARYVATENKQRRKQFADYELEMAVHLGRLLTVKLRGRAPAPARRRGRTLSPGADSTPCRAMIPRDVGPAFHGKPGQHST